MFPLIVAFGGEVVHGGSVYGGPLRAEVEKAIRTCNAMIGFTTRREPTGPAPYRTHEWVLDELLIAHDHPMPWVEVREHGVISPGGKIESAGAQRIDFREDDRARCLVKIAEALRRFHDMTKLTRIRLGPSPIVEQISPYVDDPSLMCSYQILRGSLRIPPQPAAVLPITGGIFVDLPGVAPGDSVRIVISTAGRTWRSDYISVDTVDVQMR